MKPSVFLFFFVFLSYTPLGIYFRTIIRPIKIPIEVTVGITDKASVQFIKDMAIRRTKHTTGKDCNDFRSTIYLAVFFFLR